MTDNFMDTISREIGTATAMDSLPRPDVSETTAEEDFNTARKNLRELISQGMDAIPNMMMLMREAQSDKMYSSGATFIKMLADLNGQLLKQSKENVKGPAPTPSGNVTITDNSTVFVGTTSEYLKQRREKKLKMVTDTTSTAGTNILPETLEEISSVIESV